MNHHKTITVEILDTEACIQVFKGQFTWMPTKSDLRKASRGLKHPTWWAVRRALEPFSDDLDLERDQDTGILYAKRHLEDGGVTRLKLYDGPGVYTK